MLLSQTLNKVVYSPAIRCIVLGYEHVLLFTSFCLLLYLVLKQQLFVPCNKFHKSLNCNVFWQGNNPLQRNYKKWKFASCICKKTYGWQSQQQLDTKSPDSFSPQNWFLLGSIPPDSVTDRRRCYNTHFDVPLPDEQLSCLFFYVWINTLIDFMFSSHPLLFLNVLIRL